jgi:predicted dehydrogenase
MQTAQRKIRVGIIGVGLGQHVHVPAFRSDPRCEVVAICSTNAERAAEVAASLDIPQSFGDWNTLVESSTVDAVAIAVPPRVQPEIAVAALTRGKPVFCEKPLAVSEQQAQEMNAAAKQNGLANVVDFEFPAIDVWQQAKSILQRGGIGQFRQVAVSWNVETYANRTGLRSWKTNALDGGGALYMFGSHVFHYVEWFAGPITRLSVRLHPATGGDTVVWLWMELADGTPVTARVSTDAFLGSGHRIDFYGNQGTLVLENVTTDYVSGFRLCHGTRQSNNLLEVAPATSTETDGRIPAVARVVSGFLDWIEHGAGNAPSFQDGLRVQHLLELARQSHELERAVGTA